MDKRNGPVDSHKIIGFCIEDGSGKITKAEFINDMKDVTCLKNLRLVWRLSKLVASSEVWTRHWLTKTLQRKVLNLIKFPHCYT